MSKKKEPNNSGWKEIPASGNVVFKFYNQDSDITVWCKTALKKNVGLDYLCFINTGLKSIFDNEEDAKNWAQKKIMGLGGQAPLTLFNSFDEEFDSFKELQSVNQKIKNFQKAYGIGYKVKTFKQEPGATSALRKVLQGWMDADYAPEGGPSDLKQKIKDEVVEYKDGTPNFSDYEIERVARTELSSMRELHKLVDWKAQGFTKVKHIAHITKNTGKKDKEFDGKVFEIEYLLKNEDDRVPLHPNCRCTYTLEG